MVFMAKNRIKSWMEKITGVFSNALYAGATPERLALSFCVGIYIAFSPFPGCHTIMMVIFKYFLNLHFPTLFIATSINNPWTMIPFFSGDYVFGYWLIHSFLGFDPGWGFSFARLFGSGKICLWSFLIGGNVLGIAASLLCYPFMYRMFGRLAAVVLNKK